MLTVSSESAGGFIHELRRCLIGGVGESAASSDLSTDTSHLAVLLLKYEGI
jgi:hypothetical protein